MLARRLMMTAGGSCWVDPPGYLDDFSRTLAGSTGCTSFGGYAWSDDYGNGDLAVDGSWHITIGGIEFTNEADVRSQVQVPIDAKAVVVEFELTLALPESPGSGQHNQAALICDVFRDLPGVSTDQFRFTVIVIGAPALGGFTTYLDVDDPAGSGFHEDSGAGNLLSTAQTVTVTITPSTYTVAVAGLTKSWSWTSTDPAVGSDSDLVIGRVRFNGHLRNDGYYDLIAPTLNSDFDLRVDNLLVAASIPNCVAVPMC